MTTGAEFAKFANKKISGFEDFGVRMLGYLRTLHSENLSKLFQEGSFDEVMGLSSPGVDQVQVDAKATVSNQFDCHDGAGHILDLTSILKSVLFENTAATTYEVGAGFVEKPVGIAINPRTGKPDYLKLVEGVGDEADPDTVTDNGNGTITLRVDALFESGVAVADNTGRIVRVFKKVPADNALTESVAIEELAVFFGGGQNQITTVAALGQSTISTTAADYTVQLSGITVRKNTATNKPSTSATHFFAGTALGNGGTPVTFDVSAQFILKSQSASQITFFPHKYVTSIDVQAAIEELIDDLEGTTLPGASKIGVENASWNQVAMNFGDSGGLGTSTVQAQVALQNANDQLLRRRVMSLTMADGTTRTKADVSGLNAIDSIGLLGSTAQRGGRYYLHRGDYEFNALAKIPQGFPVVIGEEGGDTFGTMPAVELPGTPAADFNLRGRWERVYLKHSATDGSRYVVGSDGLGQGVFDSCHFDTGLRVSSDGSDPKNCTIFRGVQFDGSPGAVTILDGIEIDDSDSVETHWLIFDGCYFNGPAPGQNAGGATAFLHDIGITAGNNLNFFLERGMIEFRNCKFDNPRTDAPTLKFEDVRHNVRFVDCVVHGNPLSTEATVLFPATGTESHSIHFVRCIVTTETGRAFNDLRASGGGYSMVDCEFYGGEDTAEITDPQFFNVGSDADNKYTLLRNVYLQPGAAGTRATGAITKPVCEIGGFNGSSGDTNGAVSIDGLVINMGGLATAHKMPVLAIHGISSATGRPRSHEIKNITVDLAGNRLTDVASGIDIPADIEVGDSGGDTFSVIIDGLQVVDFGTRNTLADGAKSVVSLLNGVVNGLRIRKDQNETGPTLFHSVVRLGGAANTSPSGVNGLWIESEDSFLVGEGIVEMDGFGAFVTDAHMNCSSGFAQPYFHVAATGDGCRLAVLYGPKIDSDFALDAQFIQAVAGASHLMVRDVMLDISSRQPTIRAIDVAGPYASILDCFVRAITTSQANFIRATGNGSIVDGNILSAAAGVVPTIVNSGTDSQTGTNVLTTN